MQEAKEKGKKMNYEVEEVKNVYEMVDEDDYADEGQNILKINFRRLIDLNPKPCFGLNRK